MNLNLLLLFEVTQLWECTEVFIGSLVLDANPKMCCFSVIISFRLVLYLHGTIITKVAVFKFCLYLYASIKLITCSLQFQQHHILILLLQFNGKSGLTFLILV